MGQRIAVMNEGLLQQVGTPQKLYDEPVNRFVAGFIGSPSMNFVEVTVDGGGDAARLVGPGRLGRPRRPACGERCRHCRQEARRGIPPGAPRDRRGRRRERHVPGARRRRRVPRPRGAASRERREPGHRGDRGSEHRVRPGDVIKLTLPLDKLHLFDSETGEALTTDRAVAGAPATGGSGCARLTATHKRTTIGPGGIRGRSHRARRRLAGPPPWSLPDLPDRHDRAARRDAGDARRRRPSRCRGDESPSIPTITSCWFVSTGARPNAPCSRSRRARSTSGPTARSRTGTSPRAASSRRRPATGPGRGDCSAGSGPRPASRPS